MLSLLLCDRATDFAAGLPLSMASFSRADEQQRICVEDIEREPAMKTLVVAPSLSLPIVNVGNCCR